MSKLGNVEMVEDVRDAETSSTTKNVAKTSIRVPLPVEIAHLTREQQDALEKRLVRRLDFRLMPVIIIM